MAFHLTTEPHSLEAERTTLGALLLDPEKMIEVAPLLTRHDFYDRTHAAIYGAIEDLYDERTPIDFVTVSNALSGNESVQKAGGSAFLAQLCESVPTSSFAAQYARILKEKALKRRIIAAAESLIKKARDESISGEALVEAAESELLGVSRQRTDHKPRHIAEIAHECYERYAQLYEADEDSPLFGISTGFRKLDHWLMGLQAGDFVVIAARPSMGKTALALDIARHVAAEQGKRVGFFSLEMSRHQIMDRIIGGYLGVETWKLRKGNITEKEFDQIGTLIDRLKEYMIYLDDDPLTSLANLRSKARRHQLETGLDLLIIDYLQLIEVADRNAGRNRTEQVTQISRGLKNLARELQCPVIVLSQLSRACEQRNPPIPVLSDLRESGAIEQDADGVLMLYRPGYYNPDFENPELTDVYVRKNRNGPTGTVELRFDMARMCFHEVTQNSPGRTK